VRQVNQSAVVPAQPVDISIATGLHLTSYREGIEPPPVHGHLGGEERIVKPTGRGAVFRP
jgi:hypothetical protein